MEPKFRIYCNNIRWGTVYAIIVIRSQSMWTISVSQEVIWRIHMAINEHKEIVMRKILINMMLLVAMALAMSSCEKKINDWDVDPSYAGLFRSLSFETNRIGATDVEIRYTQTVSADKYIFEFSKDSLEFNEIVKTVEILADTLTPFAPSTTPTRVVYHTIFEDLDGTAPYSVRMKGVNTETSQESGYVELFFKTTAEQLFSGAQISLDQITMYWPATDNVTHIMVNDSTDDDAEVR